jgi:hypothetical protein
VDSVWEQKKLEARKMLDAKRAEESHTSDAPLHVGTLYFTEEQKRLESILPNGRQISRTLALVS